MTISASHESVLQEAPVFDDLPQDFFLSELFQKLSITNLINCSKISKVFCELVKAYLSSRTELDPDVDFIVKKLFPNRRYVVENELSGGVFRNRKIEVGSRHLNSMLMKFPKLSKLEIGSLYKSPVLLLNDRLEIVVNNCKNLTSLTVKGYKIEDKGLLVLKLLPKLTELHLIDCEITDQSLANVLVKMTKTTDLELKRCKGITSSFISVLEKLPALKWVDFTGSMPGVGSMDFLPLAKRNIVIINLGVTEILALQA